MKYKPSLLFCSGRVTPAGYFYQEGSMFTLKKSLIYGSVLALASALLLFTGCPTTNTPDPFVAVTDITGVPSGATVGVPVNLGAAAVVSPSNATNTTIVWSVKDADTTGLTSAAVASGTFTPNAAGTVTLTATIANGTAQGTSFTKDFIIIISVQGDFVAVTNITGVPTGGTTGTPVDLTAAEVVPGTATNQDIVWTVKDAGTTGLTSADVAPGVFTPANKGTVKLTATIANGAAQGTAYTRDFDIIIYDPGEFVAVTDITGVPDSGTVGTPVSLAGATPVPNTATYGDITWRVKTAGAGILAGAAITTGFTPTSAGTLVLEAVIASGAAEGTPYVKEFSFTIAPAFVAVTDITGIPETRNAVTGTALDLNSGVEVVPGTATNKNILWSVKTPGTTGLTNTMVAAGSFTPTSAGTVVLTATIQNGIAQGEDFTKETSITIIKPVTDITGVPTNGTRGYEVNLAGAVVEPGDATHRTIVWSVKTTGAGVTSITGSSFTPSATGTVKLTATIADGSAVGTAYAKDFDIVIGNPGETTPGFGLGDYASISLRGSNGTASEELSPDAAITIDRGTAYYVSVVGGTSYTGITWYLNGAKQDVTGNLIYLDTSASGTTVKLYVEAQKDDELESSKTYTFRVN
jgi:endo-1,4-beta-xylanase